MNVVPAPPPPSKNNVQCIFDEYFNTNNYHKQMSSKLTFFPDRLHIKLELSKDQEVMSLIRTYIGNHKSHRIFRDKERAW